MELKREDGESNPQQTEFTKLADVEHPYPATKLAWAPAAVVSHTDDDILATAGDYLRLWKVDGDGGNTKMKSLLNNNRHTGIVTCILFLSISCCIVQVLTSGVLYIQSTVLL